MGIENVEDVTANMAKGNDVIKALQIQAKALADKVAMDKARMRICSICKIEINEYNRDIKRVYDSDLGFLKVCEDCQGIAIIYYARKLYGLNAKKEKDFKEER